MDATKDTAARDAEEIRRLKTELQTARTQLNGYKKGLQGVIFILEHIKVQDWDMGEAHEQACHQIRQRVNLAGITSWKD